MKTPELVLGAVLAAAIGLVMTSSPVMAQDPNPDGSRTDLRRVDPSRKVPDGKGGTGIDFAAARADANAKANARQNTDVDVKNKLTQKQNAIATGGSASADVKNKVSNVNVNTLKTGDITNYNSNDNKQIQTFGVPFSKERNLKVR